MERYLQPGKAFMACKCPNSLGYTPEEEEREVSRIFDIENWTSGCTMTNNDYPTNFAFLRKGRLYAKSKHRHLAGNWIILPRYSYLFSCLDCPYTGRKLLQWFKLTSWQLPPRVGTALYRCVDCYQGRLGTHNSDKSPPPPPPLQCHMCLWIWSVLSNIPRQAIM